MAMAITAGTMSISRSPDLLGSGSERPANVASHLGLGVRTLGGNPGPLPDPTFEIFRLEQPERWRVDGGQIVAGQGPCPASAGWSAR